MSFIDDIANKLFGSSGGGGNPTVTAVLQMVNNHPGGFSGLLQTFHEKGLGGVASSWVDTGENQSISADQIRSVLGEEHIKQFAAKVGIPPDQASSKLAEYLPQVVDKLTPNGQVPTGNLMELGKSLLKSFTDKAA
jgi:uncharacterized protein YidB (DUF937 family)